MPFQKDPLSSGLSSTCQLELAVLEEKNPQGGVSERDEADFTDWGSLPEPAAQRKGPAAVMGLLAMRGWTALCPKVKLEGEKDTTGCRLIRAVADLVKHSVREETTSCAVDAGLGGARCWNPALA